MPNETSYVTSERYHKLNKKSSYKSVIRSTSTFFYDLDSLTKRHSYQCITNILGDKNNKQQKCNFKSTAIVQECATLMKPKLLNNKNLKSKNKIKTEKSFPNDTLLSPEKFLRDNEKTYFSYKSPSEDISPNERHQKFWSFAKYRTEYTNPVTEENELKKKDHGKRTEDPCPCQLFSYACPCTNKKSLTELAKNIKSLTIPDELTSTHHFFSESPKCNKHKCNKINEIKAFNKRTSTIDIIYKNIEMLSSELQSQNKKNNMVRKKSEVIANTMKIKNSRKHRQVLCPNCKEVIEVTSTTEEEESLKSQSSPLNRNKELSTAPAYTYQDSKDNSKIVGSRECNHKPQCESIPVCQILPNDNIHVNQNMTNKTSPLKPTPRVIRITKGCRHHPPCTVVPSCQRVNVMNNNCEYIPPCLHRPRCVNLPLCAPISKSVYYDEPTTRCEEDVDTTECLHMYHNRYMTSHPSESLKNQMSRVQKTCELGCISPLPCQLSYPICKHCNSEKSCQYDFLDWKLNIESPVKKCLSNEDVIFIRDVGCQFRNKNFFAKDSVIRDNTSSGSFNSIDKYSNNFYTLRYEDKFTIPLSGEVLSGTASTISSAVIDCRRNRENHKVRPTGFVPKFTISPYVAYSSTYPSENDCFSVNDNYKKKNNVSSNASLSLLKKRLNVFLVKSRSSFFKGKYKNVLRRKRKSKTKHQTSTLNIS